MKTARLTELGLLTAIALIIFVIELQLPGLTPIPGLKLGLANIITVYAVYHYSARETAMIAVTRIILGAVFSGRVMALAYSLAGGIACLTGMLILKHFIDEKYIWASSMLGAVLHNIGQIMVAVFIVGSFAPIFYLPVLLIAGCMAGLFTELCAGTMMQRGCGVKKEVSS